MLMKLMGSVLSRPARALRPGILAAILLSLGTAALFLSTPPAQAQNLPHVFSGEATIDGRLVSDGTEVTAVVDGQTVVRATVADGRYTLLVAPPRGQFFTGKTITFTVGDTRAREQVAYKSGSIEILNLNGDSSLSAVVGDLNGDGEITIVDLTIMSSIWGLATGAPGFDAAADLNNNGRIDQPDLDTLMENYKWGQ